MINIIIIETSISGTELVKGSDRGKSFISTGMV